MGKETVSPFVVIAALAIILFFGAHDFIAGQFAEPRASQTAPIKPPEVMQFCASERNSWDSCSLDGGEESCKENIECPDGYWIRVVSWKQTGIKCPEDNGKKTCPTVGEETGECCECRYYCNKKKNWWE